MKNLTLVSLASQKKRIKKEGLKKYAKKYGKKISKFGKRSKPTYFFKKLNDPKQSNLKEAHTKMHCIQNFKE